MRSAAVHAVTPRIRRLIHISSCPSVAAMAFAFTPRRAIIARTSAATAFT